jgi:hypothetical protein
MMPDVVPLPATLLDRFSRLGVDVDALLRRAAIPRSRFDAAKPHGTTAEFFALWRAAEESGVGPGLGIRTGSETDPRHQSVAYLVALHSATLGDGLRKLARYKRLVCPEEVTIEVAHGEAKLRFEWLLAQTDPPPMLVDGVFAGVVDMARRGSGGCECGPRRLELTRRRAHEAMLRAAFRLRRPVRRPAGRSSSSTQAALALASRHAQRGAARASSMPGLESALEEEGHVADARRRRPDHARGGDLRRAPCRCRKWRSLSG